MNTQLWHWKQKPPLGYQLDPAWVAEYGVVGFWAFNEGVGTQVNDLSPNRNLGTYQNAASPQTQWTPGNANTVLSFNGTNQYVNCGQPSILAFTGSFTAGVRVYLGSSFSSSGFQAGICRWSDSANRGWWLGLGGTSSGHNGAVAFIGEPTLETTAAVNSTQAQSFFVRVWTDLILTFSAVSGLASLYVNGILSGSTSTGYSSIGTAALNTLVGNQTDNTAYWNGMLDRPFIANKAWTADQVSAYFANPWAGFRTPNIRRWFGAGLASPPPPALPPQLLLIGVG